MKKIISQSRQSVSHIKGRRKKLLFCCVEVPGTISGVFIINETIKLNYSSINGSLFRLLFF